MPRSPTTSSAQMRTAVALVLSVLGASLIGASQQHNSKPRHVDFAARIRNSSSRELSFDGREFAEPDSFQLGFAPVDVVGLNKRDELEAVSETNTGAARSHITSSPVASSEQPAPSSAAAEASSSDASSLPATSTYASSVATATSAPTTSSDYSSKVTMAATPTQYSELSPAAAGISPTGSCASSYNGGVTISGTGLLPKPTTFVRRALRGPGLIADGQPFRLVGPNLYWLCNDENVPGVPVGFYADKGRVREALAIAVAMGANTIRVHTCGISNGFPYAVEPALNQFGAEQWDIHDYVIYAAGQYGLRVILPLTDNYDYYHGGKYTYLRWRGVDTGAWGYRFYTDTNVVQDYLTYITQVLQHTNVYNGLKYSEDPTIAVWETGNELGGYIGHDGYPPASWTTQIANTIKTLAPNQLIMDGTGGFYNYTTKETAAGLNIDNIDLMSDHGYPRNIALLQAETGLVRGANKGFVVGEWDWTNDHGGDSLADYLQYIETTNFSGSLVWSVFGHDAQCCGFVTHNDGYSIYYPNGNSREQQLLVQRIVLHFYRMSGRQLLSRRPPSVACPQIPF